MRRARWWITGALLAVLLLAGLVWFLPARWAWPLLAQRVKGARLEGLHGLIWDGRADTVIDTQGHPLGALQWTLSRRLLFGRLHLDAQLEGPGVRASGTLERLPDGRQAWRDAHLDYDLAGWGASAGALGQPLGRLTLDVRQAILQGNWPTTLDALANWHDARMRSDDGVVVLGDLQLRAHGQGGVIALHADDTGQGPLALAATADVSPLGWRYDATLRPRGADPALRRWLIRVGPAQADGSVRLHGTAGLGAALPASGAAP